MTERGTEAACVASLADNGDLLMRRTATGDGSMDRRSLVRALAQPSWLDPERVGRADEASAHHPADPSDTFVFERTADPGEWAVSGAFMFADADPRTLDGKPRAAFRSGFLGVPSLGWSTLVQIVEVSEIDRAALVEMLARELHEHLGAPDLGVAHAAAEEEVMFAASLCDHPQIR